MGSEVGVVDVPNWDIASKGRLMPGNIFLVDFDAGRVIKDEEARLALSLAPLALMPSRSVASQHFEMHDAMAVCIGRTCL